MSNNDQNNTSSTPITVLPPGSGDQINTQRKWEDAERTNTRSIMDQQTRRIAPE